MVADWNPHINLLLKTESGGEVQDKYHDWAPSYGADRAGSGRMLFDENRAKVVSAGHWNLPKKVSNFVSDFYAYQLLRYGIHVYQQSIEKAINV